MSHYCSPLRYPGGKNCIFSFVSNLFYENQLIGVSYAEPYAGGSGLALRLLFEEYVDRIFINDLDKSIYAFWKVILENTDDFCEWVYKTNVTLDSWRHYKKIQHNKNTANLNELAKSTFFLNRTNVSGVIKGGVIGGFEQHGKYKIDARFNKNDLIARIQKIARFKNRISVTNFDGLAFIRKLNRKNENVFVYIDPPYYLKGADLYMNAYTEKDHQKLSKHIHKMHKNWMVSYDNSEFILKLYGEKHKFVYKLSQSTSNRVGDEVLIFSENISFNNSMAYLREPILV